jgi:ABC-type lipoprotein release transport system permease subunit
MLPVRRGVPLGLFRYAVLDVLRNRRRTFSSILGILLAITFISGTFVAIDSSTRATLFAYLDQGGASDLALNAYGPGTNATSVRDAGLAVPGVTDVSLTKQIYAYQVGSNRTSANQSGTFFAVDPDHLPSMLRGRELVGSIALPRGEVVLTEELADALVVGLGDRVFLIVPSYDTWGNYTGDRTLNLTVEGILGKAPAYTTSGPLPGPFPYFDNVAAIHIADADWASAQLGIDTSYASLNGEVWIDRERLIDPYDLAASRRNVARLERQLQTALLPYGVGVSNNIGYRLDAYASTIGFQRILYLAFSLPVLLLGLYLGAVGVELGHAERRRELAVLRTRGAGRGQVVGLLLLEAVVGGLLAAVLGLFAGIALSRLLLTSVSLFAPVSTVRYEDLLLTPGTVATVAILSVVLMALISIRSARRTANLPIVETLRHHAPGETTIRYRPAIDIVLVSVAGITYAGLWYMRSTPGDLLVFLLGIVFILLLPFAPAFLVIGTTRLLTRSTGRVYELASRLLRPLAKNLHHVMSRNLARNPRRSSSLALIISLGLAFGIFVFALAGSTVAHTQRLLRDSIGADVSVDGPPADAAGFRSNVSALPGVAGTSLVTNVGVQATYGYPAVWAFEPDAYFAVAQPAWFYFRPTDAPTAAALLRANGSALVSEGYFNDAFLDIGDRILLRTTLYNDTGWPIGEASVNVTVAGVVRGLPGLAGGYSFGLPTAIYASEETLAPFLTGGSNLGRTVRLLADLASGADPASTIEAISDLGATFVRSYDLEAARTTSDPTQQGLLSFIRMEIAFIVVILTAGLGLILYVATLERDVEFAAIAARGASGFQVAGLLVGEAIAVLLIGLAIGVSMGLLTAYLFLSLFVFSAPGAPEPLVPFTFELSPDGFLLLALAPGAMVLAAVLVSWRIARMDIARVLKIRGG